MGNSFSRVAAASGFNTLIAQPRSTHLLCLSRFFRMFAYGTTALILVLFLSSLGNPDTRIGAFMTATLLGDVIISFILTLFADGLGRRRILTVGSLLMVAAGLVFAFSGNYWVLVLASIVGVISPAGNEIGPFKAVEESTMAQLCTDKSVRSDVFAWYNLIGSAGSALGQMCCGLAVTYMQSRPGWVPLDAYRVMFVVYAGLGVVKAILSLMLASDCEVIKTKVVEPVQASLPAAAMDTDVRAGDADEGERLLEAEGVQTGGAKNSNERTPLLKSSTAQDTSTAAKPANTHVQNTSSMESKRGGMLSRLVSILPPLSPQSRQTVLRLSLLFALDSFASGLVPMTWQTYYFTRKFSPLAPSTLGWIFSTASIIASISNLFAAALAKRIGLIQTMVFTHLPSAICLALIPASPYLYVAAAFLWLRSSTSTMDAAPRQAFLSMAVLSAERTAVMGVVNVVKTTSQSIGPTVTGALASRGWFWIAFVTAGALKSIYDLSMLGMFVGFKAPEEEEVAGGSVGQGQEGRSERTQQQQRQQNGQA